MKTIGTRKKDDGARSGVIIADLHVGSYAGLCPPGKFSKDDKKLRRSQEETYHHYQRFAKENRGVDILLVNGDCIEGKGSRNGGIELWTSDLLEQTRAAAQLIRMFNAKTIRMSFGTNYHVAAGSGERLEQIIANDLSGTIHNRHFMNIGGVVVDMRHKVGSSSIPHGRHTSISKEAVWCALMHERGIFPKVDVIIRSHTHYYIANEDVRCVCINTPCLQLPRTNYGGCECSGDINWGIIKFYAEGGNFSWSKDIVDLSTAKVRVERL